MLDPEVCYRALLARDERFDGRFFVGVVTTGIYCRPVCPAGPAKAVNCRYFPSAAAAQKSGFRPCWRCRPETAPNSGAWRATSSTVARGMRLIAEGALDGEGGSVGRLAERLGIGERQLRRLFERTVGASPIAVAQTRRVLLAKQLIHETHLPLSEVAFAAGFGSVRRFNEVFAALFGRAPSELRRDPRDETPMASGSFSVLLRYRPPYDFEALLGHLRARAIDGVEAVTATSYRRTVDADGALGALAVSHVPERRSVAATFRLASLTGLSSLVERVRRLFDLEVDIEPIADHLRSDAMLASLVDARPGLRVAGSWDRFELAVRAVLGQQVTVAAARRLGGALVECCGRTLSSNEGGDTALRRSFPDARAVAAADLERLPMPRARTRALRALAEAAMTDPSLFEPLGSVEQTVARLVAIRGIGEWTAHYIALRASREPDAFPSNDAALRRSAGRLDPGADARRPNALTERAARWRPWRGYAAQHLWAADAAHQLSRVAS